MPYKSKEVSNEWHRKHMWEKRHSEAMLHPLERKYVTPDDKTVHIFEANSSVNVRPVTPWLKKPGVEYDADGHPIFDV
jgi:hypothetical protein